MSTWADMGWDEKTEICLVLKRDEAEALIRVVEHSAEGAVWRGKAAAARAVRQIAEELER